MKCPAPGNLFVFLFILLFPLLGFSFFLFFQQTYREYATVKDREADYIDRLTKVERELVEKEEYLDRLLNDPAFLEKVIREKLGYVRPGEYLFRFEKDE